MRFLDLFVFTFNRPPFLIYPRIPYFVRTNTARGERLKEATVEARRVIEGYRAEKEEQFQEFVKTVRDGGEISCASTAQPSLSGFHLKCHALLHCLLLLNPRLKVVELQNTHASSLLSHIPRNLS